MTRFNNRKKENKASILKLTEAQANATTNGNKGE
jgi:hypothetical protein